jgi:cob(I)alamin adenosyltransferase
MEKSGYVHIYTGTGKGKTTAALGLIVRAAGAGFSVLLVQFLKRPEYSEHAALKLLGERVTVRTFGGERRIGAPAGEEDRRLARQGLEFLRQALASEMYDIVVADEIVMAAHLGVLPEHDVLELLDIRPPSLELVLTGRYASQELLARADLITEMKEIRHYFNKGVPARKGIEK